MNRGLFSQEWQRIAHIKPRLRAHLKLHRLVYRDQAWYVAEDQSNGSQTRLNDSAYEFACTLTGDHTVDEIWHTLLLRRGNDAPDQHEVIQLLSQLHQSDLIRSDSDLDTEELFTRSQKNRRKRTLSQVNPLAFRAPLWNPTRLLDKLEGVTPWLFNGISGLLWTLLTLVALLVGVQHWDAITREATAHLPTARYWVLLWFVYPALKFAHEMGHALAVRHYGGKVHEMGITLLVLMPVPYVDASAANLFPNRGARMLVSAAGILVEVFFSAIALLVWLNISDGLLRDLAFVTMTVGGVSTLLFNGNPLVRFDGYHFLADWLEIPALARRSAEYWGWLGKRYLLRVEQAEPMFLAQGERKWLFAYAPLSWSYRWLVLAAVITWFADISLLLTSLVAALFLHSLLAKPLLAIFRYLLQSGDMRRHKLRAWTSLTALLTLLVVAVTVVPMPYATVAQAVIWVPGDAMLTAGSAGFVERILVRENQWVAADEPILELRNDGLKMQQQQLQAKQQALEVQYRAAQQSDPAEARALREEIRRNRAENERLQSELAALVIRSRGSGEVVIPQLRDLQGRYINKGDTVGYVFGNSDTRLRAAIPQNDADKLREYPGPVALRFTHERELTIAGKVLGAQPASSRELPSAALGFSAGGKVLTRSDDPDGLKTVEPVLLVDVSLPGHRAQHIGNRAWLRFDHGRKPLLQQWMLRWEQLFMQHFSIKST